jgi:hypothetical protein
VRVRNLARRGKRPVEVIEQVVEPDLLYPLVRWADVARYGARPSACVILSQNVTARTGIAEPVMRRAYPRTLAYFRRFERVLAERAAYRQYQQGNPPWSMYNVGTYTVAPIKVIWRRMDRRLRAAVVEPWEHPVLGPRPVVPQETCVLIAADSAAEAHYLCSVLNSAVVNFLVTSHSVHGGKGFGSPSMLDYLRLGRFDPADARHVELAEASQQAHVLAAAGADVSPLQRRVDQLAAELWGLDERELAAIRGA